MLAAALGGLVLITGQRQGAAPSPPVTPTATLAGPTPTATTEAIAPPTTSPPTVSGPCQNTYETWEAPIVQPRRAGRFAEVALDSVRQGPTALGNTARWNVRAFNPADSGGDFAMPLRASLRSSDGAEVAVVGYEAGPPNGGSGPVTELVAIPPCDPTSAAGIAQSRVILIVHTAPIASGRYVLTLRDVQLPEGGTRDESWTIALTCGAPDPGNPVGTRCQ